MPFYSGSFLGFSFGHTSRHVLAGNFLAYVASYTPTTEAEVLVHAFYPVSIQEEDYLDVTGFYYATYLTGAVQEQDTANTPVLEYATSIRITSIAEVDTAQDPSFIYAIQFQTTTGELDYTAPPVLLYETILTLTETEEEDVLQRIIVGIFFNITPVALGEEDYLYIPGLAYGSRVYPGSLQELDTTNESSIYYDTYLYPSSVVESDTANSPVIIYDLICIPQAGIELEDISDPGMYYAVSLVMETASEEDTSSIVVIELHTRFITIYLLGGDSGLTQQTSLDIWRY